MTRACARTCTHALTVPSCVLHAAAVGILTEKLRGGAVSAAVFERLTALCQSLAVGDARTALDVHVQITTSDWADNGPWLMGVKRLIEMTSKLGVTL